MEGNYTTLLKQQKLELSDVYYLTCEASNEGAQREFPLAGSFTKFILVATLTAGTGSYSVEAKNVDAQPKEVSLITNGLGQIPKQQMRFSPVDNGNLSIEVNRSPSYQPVSRKIREANLDRLERTHRQQLLMASFQKNKTEDSISFASMMTMRIANRQLVNLPFLDSILQYDKFDNVCQYNFFFDKEVELSISVYVDEEKMSDDVDYSIYHKGELVVANTLPIQQLVKKMKTVIAKVQKNG